MTRLREEEWGVSRRVAVAVAVAPVLGGVLVAAAAVDGRLYRVLVREDAVLEWLQVAAWIVAAAVSARLAIRERSVLWALFGLASLVALGEELDWGQRIIGFGTPDVLRDDDKQEEATLHNVRAFEDPARAAVALVALVGAVAPWCTRRAPRFLVPAFALVAGYELVRIPAGQNPGYTFAKWSEWPELCFAGALAAFAVLWARRSGRRGFH